MPTWNERFRRGSYPQDPDPSTILVEYSGEFPAGPALDIGTGTGRNAVFLASSGYEVDAIDKARAGLQITRRNAVQKDVAHRINPIQADIGSFEFPTDRYAVVTISFYRAIDRFPDVKEALIDGGYLFVEHHLRSTDPTPSGPSGNRYRFAANELLHACLDLTVLYYDETSTQRPGGRRGATTRILARNSSGTRQSYPRRPTEHE